MFFIQCAVNITTNTCT